MFGVQGCNVEVGEGCMKSVMEGDCSPHTHTHTPSRNGINDEASALL